MKIALCFIINYDHILNKEHIWRKWIEPNQDIINVYFYYKDLQMIQSDWIRERAIPQNRIYPTSYLRVIPAYMSLMNYAIETDRNNKWFVFLTDSCCPIIPAAKFRSLFQIHCEKSIIRCRRAWWNPYIHMRANLAKLPNHLRLGNDPWFILTRSHVQCCITFVNQHTELTKLVCDGGLANESLFAIILTLYKQHDSVLSKTTHVADWSRMTSSTSPYVFRKACNRDIEFIEKSFLENEFIMFIRKVAPEYPDEIIMKYLEDSDPSLRNV